jgi:hypothetical protein
MEEFIAAMHISFLQMYIWGTGGRSNREGLTSQLAGYIFG